MICRKCHQTMLGPRWDKPTDALTYTCFCGFKEVVPAKDTMASFAGELERILKQAGIKPTKETP